MKIITGLRSGVGFLAALLLACWFLPGLGPERWVSPGVGVCRAEDPAIVLQTIGVRSEKGTLKVFQGISGFEVWTGAYTDHVGLDLSSSSLYGVLNLNEASGGVGINQAGVFNCNASVNSPGLLMAPMTASVNSVLKNNALDLGNNNFSTSVTGQGFGGAGVFMLNQTAGNLNNSFTSVGVSIGPVLPAPDLPTHVMIHTGPNGAAIALSNAQLKAFVATNDNTLQSTGQQTASATIEGQAFHNFAGVAAITQVSGNLNQVVNTVQVNINR
jgi:hypothetical protein